MIKIVKKANFNSNVMWLVIVMFFAVITGTAIADTKWIYLGIVFIPFILYICIEKPFIFPFGLYIFFIPLDSVFVLTEAGRGTALTKFAAYLAVSVLLMKGVFEKKLKQPDNVAILWMLFVLLGVSSYCWAINPEVTLSLIRNPVGLVIFYLIVSSYKIHRKEYETLKWFIIGGGILAGIISLYNYQQLLSSHDSLDRMGVIVGGHSSGLNSLAFGLLLPVATCIEKILEQRKKLIKGFLCIVLGIILFSIVLTGSRGAMLGVAAIFVVYLLSIKQRVSYASVFIIIGIMLVPFIPDFFFERWGKVAETGGSGRSTIWYVGLLSLEKYLPIGAGLGNFPMAFDEYYIPVPGLKSGRASHNTFLGIFVELGIIGISLMILALWKSYQKIQSQLKNIYTTDSIMLKAAFWGLIIPSFTGDNAFDKSLWLLLMMISMYSYVLVHDKLPYK